MKPLETYNYKENPRLGDEVLGTVLAWSEKKKQQAQAMNRELETSVRLKA